jgi:hypothetical protein
MSYKKSKFIEREEDPFDGPQERTKRGRGHLVSIDRLMDRSSKSGFLYFLSHRARVSQVWRDAVGPKVCANTAIHSFNLSTLQVFVRSPAHLERYRYFLKDWKKRMNIEFGDEMVTEIALKIGPVG